MGALDWQQTGTARVGRAVAGLSLLLLSAPRVAQLVLESIVQPPETAYQGWRILDDLGFIGSSVAMLTLAALLGAALAFPVKNRRTANTIEDIETPQIYTIYAVVGAIVGIMVVQFGMAVGFVLFGIGGLIRFRTILQSASRTGRVILVTLIGLSCGLNLPQVALMATTFLYVLIFIMDSRITYRMQVKGVDPKLFCETHAAYQDLLEELDCRILGVKKYPRKRRLIYIFRCARSVDGACLENLFEKRIDPSLRATVEWEID